MTMKRIFLLLPFSLSIAFPANASIQGKIFKDPLGAIYVYSQIPGTGVSSISAFPPARVVSANNCGLVVVRPLKNKPDGRMRIEGVTVTPSKLPTQLIPRCLAGILEEPRPANFKAPDGRVVFVRNPNARYQLSWLDAANVRIIKANRCGYVKFPAGAFDDRPVLPTLSGKVAVFKFATLPNAPGLYCKNQTGQRWEPVPFPPQLAEAETGTETTIETFGGYDLPSEPPTIAFPASSFTVAAGTTINIPITLTDSDTDLNALTLSVSGSSANLVQSSTFTGTGGSRSASIVLSPTATGSGFVEIQVSDGLNVAAQTVTIQISAPIASGPAACFVSPSLLRVTNVPTASQTYQIIHPKSSGTNTVSRFIGPSKTADFALVGFVPGTITLKNQVTLQTVKTFDSPQLGVCP